MKSFQAIVKKSRTPGVSVRALVRDLDLIISLKAKKRKNRPSVSLENNNSRGGSAAPSLVP